MLRLNGNSGGSQWFKPLATIENRINPVLAASRQLKLAVSTP